MAAMLFPTELALVPEAREVLEKLEKSYYTPQKLAERARIILELAEGGSNYDVAKRLGMNKATTTKWRARWEAAREQIEGQVNDPKALRLAISEVLNDSPRSGGPPTFTPEQVAAIVAMACEPPEKQGVPVSEWSSSLLAEEAVSRGVVGAISPATVWRFLKSGRPQASQGAALDDQARRRPQGVRQPRR